MCTWPIKCYLIDLMSSITGLLTKMDHHSVTSHGLHKSQSPGCYSSETIVLYSGSRILRDSNSYHKTMEAENYPKLERRTYNVDQIKSNLAVSQPASIVASATSTVSVVSSAFPIETVSVPRPRLGKTKHGGVRLSNLTRIKTTSTVSYKHLRAHQTDS